MLLGSRKIRWIDIIIVGFLLSILVFIVILFYLDYRQKQEIDSVSSNLQLQSSKDKILSYEEGLDPNTSESIISYIYVTDNLVASDTYQGYQEDITKRTSNSRAYKKPSDDLELENYVAKFYSGTPFHLDEGIWKSTEYATTTKTAFLLQTENTPLDYVKNVFGQPVFAAIDKTFSLGVDGNLLKGNAAWSVVHTDSPAALVGGTNVYGGTGSSHVNLINDTFLVNRLFFSFYTEHLPDNAIILSADLRLVSLQANATTGDGLTYLTVLKTDQANPNGGLLITSDWDNCGPNTINPDGSDELIDIVDRPNLGDIVDEIYTSFPLNVTGISWISKTGYTNLGIRDGHDVQNIEPPYHTLSNAAFYMSEQSGTTKDPYLEIEYVLPTKIIINNGRLQINNSKLQID